MGLLRSPQRGTSRSRMDRWSGLRSTARDTSNGESYLRSQSKPQGNRSSTRAARSDFGLPIIRVAAPVTRSWCSAG